MYDLKNIRVGWNEASVVRRPRTTSGVIAYDVRHCRAQCPTSPYNVRHRHQRRTTKAFDAVAHTKIVVKNPIQ